MASDFFTVSQDYRYSKFSMSPCPSWRWKTLDSHVLYKYCPNISETKPSKEDPARPGDPAKIPKRSSKTTSSFMTFIYFKFSFSVWGEHFLWCKIKSCIKFHIHQLKVHEKEKSGFVNFFHFLLKVSLNIKIESNK